MTQRHEPEPDDFTVARQQYDGDQWPYWLAQTGFEPEPGDRELEAGG